ncbi:MAG TPA: hypothetical protein VL356_09880 [Acidocella sp.]|nr:hypothetical protein [Acidocella sp.]
MVFLLIALALSMGGTRKVRQTIFRLAKLKIVYIAGCLQPCSAAARTEKESGRFLKKAAQKLLAQQAWVFVADNAHSPESIKFFCFFLFTKRRLLLALADLT